MGINWGLGVAVMLSGLLVVFTLLLILVLICWGMGKIFRAVTNRKKSGGVKPSEPAPPEAAPSKSAPVQSAVQPQTGVADDVVAAITGAIACVLGPNRPFAIRAIRRAGKAERAGRDAWSSAGIAESTRPF